VERSASAAPNCAGWHPSVGASDTRPTLGRPTLSDPRQREESSADALEIFGIMLEATQTAYLVLDDVRPFPSRAQPWWGFRMRAMLARHVFKYAERRKDISRRGIFVRLQLDCRRPIAPFTSMCCSTIVARSSFMKAVPVSDYAKCLFARPRFNDGMNCQQSQNGNWVPRRELPIHATVLSGVKVGEHGMLGSMASHPKILIRLRWLLVSPPKPVKVKNHSR